MTDTGTPKGVAKEFLFQKEQDKAAIASTVSKFCGLGWLSDTDRSACFIAV